MRAWALLTPVAQVRSVADRQAVNRGVRCPGCRPLCYCRAGRPAGRAGIALQSAWRQGARCRIAGARSECRCWHSARCGFRRQPGTAGAAAVFARGVAGDAFEQLGECGAVAVADILRDLFHRVVATGEPGFGGADAQALQVVVRRQAGGELEAPQQGARR